MSKSFAPLQFDGQMRVDANHAGNKQYNPNSFAHKFRPDVAEAPYQVSDNVMSRKSHYWHEAKKNEYDQAKELWSRVMSPERRQHTITNTFNMLKFVKYADIQVSLCPASFSRTTHTDARIEEVPRTSVQHWPRLCSRHLRPPCELRLQAGIPLLRSREAV